jgi:DNA repair protein SbcD/Mre11
VEPIRVIQTGDFHLDSLFSGGGYTQDQARQRRRDLRQTFSAVMELTRTRKAQVLLVTGDVFEHHRVSMQTMRFIRDQWAGYPDLQVLVTPGNHDPAVPDSYYHHMAWSANVHIFRRGVMECFDLAHINMAVHGFGWTTWEQKESCIKGYRVLDPSRYNLLMFHGEVNGRSGSPYCPVSAAEIAAAGFDGVAVGHIHRQQTLTINESLQARYAGSPEPLDFSETGSHGVLWGEVTKGEEWWESVPMAQREYRSVTLEAQCLSSTRALSDCLSAQGIVLSPEMLLRIEASGPRSPEAEGDLEELAAWLNRFCFFAEIRDRTYPDYDLDALLREYEDTVLADFVLEMRGQMSRAEARDLPQLQKALHLGLTALTNGRGVQK